LFKSSAKPPAAVVSAFLISLIPSHAPAQIDRQPDAVESSSAYVATAQQAPGPADQIPQPGQPGSPFPVEHFWNHFALELSGGYSPVVQKGAGYLSHGFNVTPGVVDRLSPHWALLAEVPIFALKGNLPYDNGGGNFTVSYSSTVVGLVFATEYDFLPRSRTSPYVLGGVGYYALGPATTSGTVSSDLTAINGTSSAGFNGGLGIRHRLYADRRMEIFAEGRYHYIASSSSAFGQISLLPISAGIRW
jgi:hypothetical protein